MTYRRLIVPCVLAALASLGLGGCSSTDDAPATVTVTESSTPADTTRSSAAGMSEASSTTGTTTTSSTTSDNETPTSSVSQPSHTERGGAPLDRSAYEASRFAPEQSGLLFVTQNGTYCELFAEAPGDNQPTAICGLTNLPGVNGNAATVTAGSPGAIITANRPFTPPENAPVLPVGARLVDGAAACVAPHEGGVKCMVNEHGFIITPGGVHTW